CFRSCLPLGRITVHDSFDRSFLAYQVRGGTHASPRWAFASPPVTPLATPPLLRSAVALYVPSCPLCSASLFSVAIRYRNCGGILPASFLSIFPPPPNCFIIFRA